MKILELQKIIIPESLQLMAQRYLILQTIYYNQPIGRRALAQELNEGERLIRTEVNFLKDQGLLNIDTMGMNITENGKRILEGLRDAYVVLRGIPELERRLKEILKVKEVIIVPGNTEINGLSLKEMGKITSTELKKLITGKEIIGITGGTTMASVAEEMSEESLEDVLVIPARGGVGKNLETQANSIAARIGAKLGGSYRLLYLPDNLEKEAIEIISKDKDIKESIDLINQMNILVFGIGRADNMARRRNLSQEEIQQLEKKGAVAEAFGHYFNIAGEKVSQYLTVGLTIEKFNEIDRVIGVAGGEEKAESIMAIASLRKDITIVTDEAAAKKIIEIVK